MRSTPPNAAGKSGFAELRLAMILLLACGAAVAQTSPSPPPLDLQLPAAAPHEYIGGTLPADDDDEGDDAADSSTSVHGAFTTGIGYSKAYGNSTVNAAELDVTKHYDNGKTIDMHIDVTRSTGIPTVAPRCYGGPYCGF